MKEIIKFSNVCYYTESGREIINDLSMSLCSEKIGIVGRNGVGKSTILNLIAKIIKPDSGEIQIKGRCLYVPQVIDYTKINIQEILYNIHQSIIGNVKNDIPKKILKLFDITEYLEKESFIQLSGGEGRMLLLINAFLSEGELLLLDEPESDLDIYNRDLLRKLINCTNKTVLIVSHDQKTLMNVEKIVEIKEQGIEVFGGNYNTYLEIKEKQNEVLDKKIKNVVDELEQIEANKEKVLKSQQYRMLKGKEDFFENGYSDFWCDTPKKDRAAKTLRKLINKHEKKVIEGKKLLECYVNTARIVNNITIPFPDYKISTNINKELFSMEAVKFYYNEKREVLHDFNLSVCEGDKIWLFGRNGAGKTTLINLISGKENIKGGVFRHQQFEYVVCGQKQEELNDDITLVQAICQVNCLLIEERALEIIQTSGFPISIAQRKLGTLSGGERIIATLLIALSAKKAPQILLMDEPTNHLDLQGIQQLEIILKNYKGTVIIATHDEYLMEAVGGFKKVVL